MKRKSTIFPSLFFILLLSATGFIHDVVGVRFELHATSGQGTTKCLEQFGYDGTLVSGVINVGPGKNQRVDVEIIEPEPSTNKYWSKMDVEGEQKFSFRVHSHVTLRFCFTALLADGFSPGPDVKRDVFLKVDMGSEATDFASKESAATEEKEKAKLGAIEGELNSLDGILKDVTASLNYIDALDEDMYAVNVNTHGRVASFSGLSIIVLIGVGAWQLWYLHSFFKAKKLI